MRLSYAVFLSTLALSLFGCGQKTEPQAGGVSPTPVAASNPPESSASAPPVVEQKRSAWVSDDRVDKMTGKQRNKLITTVEVGPHLYQVLFQCDEESLATRVGVFSLEKKAAPISWDFAGMNIAGQPQYAKRMRLKLGDQLTNTALEKENYANFGVLPAPNKTDQIVVSLNSVGQKKEEAQQKINESKYQGVSGILTASPILISDIFPDEVIEVDPDSDKQLVSRFLKVCRDNLGLSQGEKQPPGQPGVLPGPMPEENSSGMPADVVAFTDRRDTCDHLRSEGANEGTTKAQFEKDLTETCKGTDAQLSALKRKYSSNKAITAKLAEYEEKIEN